MAQPSPDLSTKHALNIRGTRMTSTLQRVRDLQEQIRLQEQMLKDLTQQPEYLAEQAFIQDVLDVLEIHGRTLKEAVLAIDPAILGAVVKPKAPRKPHAPRKAADVTPFKLNGAEPVNLVPAPKVSPFASFGAASETAAPAPTAEHPLEPEQKKPAKPAKRNKSTHNAARNAARRIECIKNGTWFLYTNPHTQETEEASGARTDTLRAWLAEYGKATVESWKRPITPEEAGL